MTNPFEIMQASMSMVELIQIGREAVAQFAGARTEDQVRFIVADADFADAWDNAPEEVRRDLLASIADYAIQQGVPADAIPGIEDQTAAGLLDLAKHDHDAGTQILGDNPLAPPRSKTSIFAASTVFDRDMPEEDKRAAYARIALLANSKDAAGSSSSS